MGAMLDLCRTCAEDKLGDNLEDRKRFVRRLRAVRNPARRQIGPCRGAMIARQERQGAVPKLIGVPAND